VPRNRRPHRSPGKTAPTEVRRILRLRTQGLSAAALQLRTPFLENCSTTTKFAASLDTCTFVITALAPILRSLRSILGTTCHATVHLVRCQQCGAGFRLRTPERGELPLTTQFPRRFSLMAGFGRQTLGRCPSRSDWGGQSSRGVARGPAPHGHRATTGRPQIATHSRVKSSTIFSVRNPRPSPSVSAIKSMDQRSRGPLGCANGTRAPRLSRLRRRRRTCNPAWR
jgi:hypothetical protein